MTPPAGIPALRNGGPWIGTRLIPARTVCDGHFPGNLTTCLKDRRREANGH